MTAYKSSPTTIKVNGTPIKLPTALKHSKYNMTKDGRVANGSMTMELVAKKRKLFFTYDVISGKDFEAIRALIDTNAMFFTVEWEENGHINTATMYVGEIASERFRTNSGSTSDWYLKNVKFDFIEK